LYIISHLFKKAGLAAFKTIFCSGFRILQVEMSEVNRALEKAFQLLLGWLLRRHLFFRANASIRVLREILQWKLTCTYRTLTHFTDFLQANIA
jgi:hypothetical protein